MASDVASGAPFDLRLAVDLIVALMVLEAIGLAAYRAWTGRGPPIDQLLPTLLAGMCLFLALRAVLAGLAWPWVAVCLGAALIAHLADLAQRWRRVR